MKERLATIGRLLTRRGCLFFFLLAVQVLLTVNLIEGRRLPVHDTFFAFSLQYYFLNNAVTAGEIPQWIPFLTHGTSAWYWILIQGACGPFLYVLLPVAKSLGGMKFFGIFHWAMFAQLLVLLSGVWLLCERSFRSKYTNVIVTAGVMASALWTSQIYFNLQIYYALPLIIVLGHGFLDTGRWRYAFLAVNLYLVQLLGNLGYFAAVSSLVLLFYFFSYVTLSHHDVRKGLGRISRRRPHAMFLAALLVFGTVYFLFFDAGLGENLVRTMTGRNPDGKVTLETFLTYGGRPTLTKWKETVLGYSWGKDYTFYFGILPLVSLVFGLVFGISRKSIPFLVTAAVILCFSLATPVTKVLYYTWPLMKYYRHIALTAPLAKLFLVFLAGFGFEALFMPFLAPGAERKVSAGYLRAAAAILLAAAVLFWLCSFRRECLSTMGPGARDILEGMIVRGGPQAFQDTLTAAFAQVPIFMRTAAYKFLAVGAGLLIFSLSASKRIKAAALAWLLVFHLGDVYAYSAGELRSRTMGLDERQYASLGFQEIPFVRRREDTFWNDNVRQAILADRELYEKSAYYWTYNAFVFNDQLGTSVRTDLWQRPLDDYMKAFWGQPLNEPHTPPEGYRDQQLFFPVENRALLKLSAVTEDKVQFFNRVYHVSSKEEAARLMREEDYLADILFLSPPFPGTARGEEVRAGTGIDLAQNGRLDLDYAVTRFDSNRIRLRVESPGADVWLMYSGVWHPGWRAAVNGREQFVYKAALAYMAVPLDKGLNEIEFTFRDERIVWAFRLAALNALFWLGYVLWLAVRLCANKQE